LETGIKDKVNQGGLIFYDNNVDVARLAIETMKEAMKHRKKL